jgi:muconate cycloisomerase
MSNAGIEISGRIEKMTVFTVVLPVRSRRDHGIGAVAGEIKNVLVKLETADGVAGWGEASPWAAFTGTAEAAAAALDGHLRAVVVGRPAAHVTRIMADANAILVGNWEAKAALEMALYDVRGRELTVSVSDLLGGRFRDHIPLSVSIANPDFDEDLELADRIVADGVRLFKIKTGVAGHAFDLKRLETLKQRFPEVEIRVDYNQGLTPLEALRYVPDIDKFEPGFIEQPVPAENWEVMKTLRGKIRSPLVADESVFTPAEAFKAAREGIADAFSVKIMKSGGMRRGQEIAAIAAANGMPCYGGDMFETGLAHLAGTHMCAATANISLGCEFYQATYYLETDLLQLPFPATDGRVTVPTGPGLGIAVDEDKVRHFMAEQAN